MRLSDSQRRVLGAVQLQADAPIPLLARESGLRAHSVRYALSELQGQGFLRPFPIVNVHALGYTDYCIFLSLAADNQAVRAKVLDYCVHAPQTAWVVELAGEFQYSVSIFAKRIGDVHQYFERLAELVPGVIIDKVFAIRLSWTTFRCKYLSDRPSTVEFVTRSESVAPYDADDTDHRVLRALAAQPLASRSALARECGLSASTFDYRIKKLRENGVLLGVVYYSEINRVGLHSFRILVQAKTSTAELTKQLWDFSSKHPQIVGLVHCIGGWDFELNVEVPAPTELARIHDALYAQFGSNIRMIKTLTVLSTQKTNPYPFPVERM